MRAAMRPLALIAMLAAMGVAAAEPLDMLFETPHMAQVEAGAVLRYDHTRSSDPQLGIGPDFEQTIELEMGTAQAARFVLDADGAQRAFPVNDGVPGNPLVMVFLENTLRSVAQATGGSPFYIRNRLRESMRDRLETIEPDAKFAMRPFAEDRNRDRFGPFADLEMTFELSKDAPGMLVALRVEAGDPARPIYREEIRLDDAQ